MDGWTRTDGGLLELSCAFPKESLDGVGGGGGGSRRPRFFFLWVGKKLLLPLLPGGIDHL